MQTELTTTTRHLFRCRMCCQGYASQNALHHNATSCVCGGSLQWLGRVNNGRVVIDAMAPACDDRCTGALSNKCICQCGGENHGAGMTVAIQIDNGPAPTVTPADPEACILRRDELKRTIASLWAPIHEQFPGALDRKRAGLWIDRPAFEAILAVSTRIDSAMHLTNHANRIRKLMA